MNRNTRRLGAIPGFAMTVALAITWAVSTDAAGKETPMVRLDTSKGEIVLKLHDDRTPVTVSNFLSYVDKGFYDGTVFHRVIDGFMIQGGGMTEDLKPKPTGDPIENEADRAAANQRGTVAMARTSDINSATSQFFINVTDNAFLDHRGTSPSAYGYCVFGEVVEGMDVVDAIRRVDTTRKGPHANVPEEPVVIRSATRVD